MGRLSNPEKRPMSRGVENMISTNEAVTTDYASTIKTYRQNRRCQVVRRSQTTTASSSGPFTETLKLHQTVRPDSTAFSNDEIDTSNEASVSAVHEQDARFTLVARNAGPSDVLVCGEITISFSAMEVHRSGQLVVLTRKEFNTLAYLLKNARRVVSRDELLNEVWGYDCYPCTRTVDNHILRLRKKLETEPARPKHLRTVHGTGYKFLP
jgi:DNA-binding response OmpR family regulator